MYQKSIFLTKKSDFINDLIEKYETFLLDYWYHCLKAANLFSQLFSLSTTCCLLFKLRFKTMDLDLDLSFESENEEEVTAGDMLKQMEEIWMNEKFAPEILPNNIEVVECLYLQIEEMEKNVQRLEKNDIRRCAHELELIRIRYLLSSYLRTRLMKIETYAEVILREETLRRQEGEDLYLTEAEYAFAETFKNLNGKYVINLFGNIPGFGTNDSKHNPVIPNIHSFVFFQSKKTIDGIIVDDGVNNDDVVNIKDGSKMIMTYSSINHYLKKGEVRLI